MIKYIRFIDLPEDISRYIGEYCDFCSKCNNQLFDNHYTRCAICKHIWCTRENKVSNITCANHGLVQRYFESMVWVCISCNTYFNKMQNQTSNTI